MPYSHDAFLNQHWSFEKMTRSLILALLFLAISLPSIADDEKLSAFDRVMSSGTIRCGWATNDPWIFKDIKTGEMKGITVDVMKAVADHLQLKLEWPEETGWPNLPASLENGRVDVACSSLWNDPLRGKHVAYTQPIFFTGLYIYSRAGDARFTGKIDEINSPDIKIAVQDGELGVTLAHRYFPKAQLVALPDLVTPADIYMNVTTGKADVTIGDGISSQKFNVMNEAKLSRVPLAKPLTVYGNSFAVGIHEPELKEIIDNTVRYMIQTGEIEDQTKEFRTQYPDALVLPSSPYEIER